MEEKENKQLEESLSTKNAEMETEKEINSTQSSSSSFSVPPQNIHTKEDKIKNLRLNNEEIIILLQIIEIILLQDEVFCVAVCGMIKSKKMKEELTLEQAKFLKSESFRAFVYNRIDWLKRKTLITTIKVTGGMKSYIKIKNKEDLLNIKKLLEEKLHV